MNTFSYLPVRCYDEWSQLQEVFIASVLNSSHTIDPSFRYFYNQVHTDEKSIRIPDEILLEHQQEIDAFAALLESYGVIVRHQQEYAFVTPFSTPYWRAYSRPSDNPRDQFIIIGDTVVETPPVIRDRYFENDAWKHHLYGYFCAGSRWLTAPKPIMLAGSYDWDWMNLDEKEFVATDSGVMKGPGLEIMFDGAQIIKLGCSMVMNVRSQNDQLGFEWMQREFPEYKWHAVNLGVNTDHIDGEFAVLRPGLILAAPRIVNHWDRLPQFMQSWDCIPMADKCLPDDNDGENICLASDSLYVNVLSLNENTVFISDKAHITIKQLEKHGINCIPVKYGWQRLFGGGLHCSTLDIRRAGGPENYEN